MHGSLLMISKWGDQCDLAGVVSSRASPVFDDAGGSFDSIETRTGLTPPSVPDTPIVPTRVICTS